MQTHKIVIRPLSAFGSKPQGDMLFGQLCWAVRNRFGEARLVELLADYTCGKPWLVVSDALPAGHLPRPALPGHWFEPIEGEDRKAAKKRAWLPIDLANDLHLEQWLRQCLPASEVAGATPHAHPQPHNAIDRTTGTTGEGQFAPYALERLWYGTPMSDDGAACSIASPVRLDVYAVLDETRVTPDELKRLFQDMGDCGFGRDAGVGLGKFETLACEPFDLPQQTGADACLTLAPCAPQGLGFDAARSFYQPFTRFGRHGDIGVHLGNPFKTPVLLAQTGAVLALRTEACRPFVGQGLGGDGSLSKTVEGTVHQGYAPVVGVRLPERKNA